MSFFLFCLAVAQLQCSGQPSGLNSPPAVKLRVAVFDFDETLSVGTFLPGNRQISDQHDGFGDTTNVEVTVTEVKERSFGREALEDTSTRAPMGFGYDTDGFGHDTGYDIDGAAWHPDIAGVERWLPSAKGRLAKLRDMLKALQDSGVVSVVMTYNERGASPVLNMLRAAKLDDYFVGVYDTHLVEQGRNIPRRNIPSGFVKILEEDATVWTPCEANAYVKEDGTWGFPVGVDGREFNPNSRNPLVQHSPSKAVAIEMMMTHPAEYFPTWTGIATELEKLPLESRLEAAVLVDDKVENKEFLPRFCLVPKQTFHGAGSLGGVGFLDGSDYITLLEAYPTPGTAPATPMTVRRKSKSAAVRKSKSGCGGLFSCFGF